MKQNCLLCGDCACHEAAIAEIAVIRGEFCMGNRAEGRGGCGMCIVCCKESHERAELAELQNDEMKKWIREDGHNHTEEKPEEWFWCDCSMCKLQKSEGKVWKNASDMGYAQKPIEEAKTFSTGCQIPGCEQHPEAPEKRKSECPKCGGDQYLQPCPACGQA